MNFIDTIGLAWRTIRGNKLRTALTVAIIAFGIMALIGIITAISAMNQKLTESFSTMGANAFTIRYKERSVQFGSNDREAKLSKKDARRERRSNLGKKITRTEAETFTREYRFPSSLSISLFGGRSNSASYGKRKTSPNVTVLGGDANYLQLNGFEILTGRNLNQLDVHSGRNTCILGYDVAEKLFPGEPAMAVNNVIRIKNIPYQVAAVLKSRGSTFGFSRDNVIIAAYSNVEKNFSGSYSYVIGVMTNDLTRVYEAMGEAESLFRSVRKLTTIEDKNFALDRSDSIAERAMNSLRFLTISATVIGLITLIGAAIGLMNIMLVSVSERTREVGIVKAIGGKNNMIARQFLMEAILISLMGAVIGIGLGILVGNLFSVVLNTSFVVPWGWVAYGIIICTMVGLLAGLYPALKAGRLNPIEALRYE